MSATIDFGALPSPCYVVDSRLLERNLETLDAVQRRTGCKILLALKAFSMFSAFGQIGKRLAGVTASSLFEARLGFEEMGGEVHAYCPAWREDEFTQLLGCCDHIVFNSFAQWEKFRVQALASGKRDAFGIRVNPEYSEIETAIYNPCAPYSRLGVTAANFKPDELEGISGLHFHTLCEQGADTLERTVEAVEEKFGRYLRGMKWLNLGGGHHITRPGYDIDTLERVVAGLQDRYCVQVYLEPGEAVALNAGYLACTVLDVLENGMDLAILDASAACHMPDVLEMPYRPCILGAGAPGEFAHTYRLGGPTCLAGDVIGDYSFPQPLKPGDRLVFTDMAHYTMVKNNTFNGVNLPAIALCNENGVVRVVREFGYEDFKSRLS